MTFAETLSKWRESNRWTQAAAAEFLSSKLNSQIPERTYSAWEGGTNEPHGIAKAAIEAVIKDTK